MKPLDHILKISNRIVTLVAQRNDNGGHAQVDKIDHEHFIQPKAAAYSQ